MDERDLLIQRFVDNELTAEERIHLLRTLDQDKALRRHLLDTEGLIAEAAQLPSVSPPAGFAARVRGRLAVVKHGLLQQAWEWLFASRQLQWNVGGALAAAAVLFIAVWWVGSLFVHAPGQVSVATQQQPEESTVLVRLILHQPEADSVAVAGDFNGWNPERTRLQRAEGGLWTVTVLLKPGRYHYMYVVDGRQWIADPLTSERSFDGFGAQNAVLEIDSPLWRPADPCIASAPGIPSRAWEGERVCRSGGCSGLGSC